MSIIDVNKFTTHVVEYEDVNPIATCKGILPVHKGDKMTINGRCYEVSYVDYDFDSGIFEVVVEDDD